MRIIETPDAPAHTGPVPHAGEAGGWIYRVRTVRCLGADPVTHTIPADARGEAEQLFANLAAVLEVAGCAPPWYGWAS